MTVTVSNSVDRLFLAFQKLISGPPDLTELPADVGDGDGLIPDLGDHVGGGAGAASRTCGNEIEQHAAGQGQNDHAEQDAGKKFLLIV